MNTTTCFAPAHILLPAEQIPLEQWGCIACDQFTSDREYWQRAKEAADGSPSTLNLILPEVYLEDGDADARVEQIHATMADYAQNVLTRAVDGFVYVERTEQSGRVRQGLVGKVDLEAYSYQRGAKCTVRPSESTVESRIPPRMKVRTGAALETPHIMMLADDPGCTLIEPVAAHKAELPKVYEGELMLGGDHYKWRVMLSNGVDEKYIRGDASWFEKWKAFAGCLKYCIGNPMYHWTHLELKTAFGIDKILNPKTAREIYDECNEKLKQPEYSARGMMRRYHVETVCTTDDPIDSLEYHIKTRESGFEIKMLPTWRPDKAMAVEVPGDFRAYVEKLAEVSGVTISTFDDMIAALRKRHDFFAAQGCKLSDHGIEEFYAEDYTDAEIKAIFNKVYGGTALTKEEILKFKSAMLIAFGEMDWEKGGTQQFHY